RLEYFLVNLADGLPPARNSIAESFSCGETASNSHAIIRRRVDRQHRFPLEAPTSQDVLKPPKLPVIVQELVGVNNGQDLLAADPLQGAEGIRFLPTLIE